MGFWRGDLTHQPPQGITGIHSAPPTLTHCGSKIPSLVFQNAHSQLQDPGEQFGLPVLLGNLHWLHTARVTWIDDR